MAFTHFFKMVSLCKVVQFKPISAKEIKNVSILNSL